MVVDLKQSEMFCRGIGQVIYLQDPYLCKVTSNKCEISGLCPQTSRTLCCFSKRLVHWDVDNENLHGGYFEWATGKHDILAQMFTDVNQVDPNAKLFINDYNVVSWSGLTVVRTFSISVKI